jgi:3-hydroxyisobutyrate dehydrogenase-like beta-hydroxyacid dehydrogenase
MNLIGQPIAVIGLGYVGLPLAVEFGKRYPVTGFDIKPERIAELQAGRDSTLEVPPEELAAATQLRFTSDPAALRNCRVFIVTVPTPVDGVNRPDFTPLIRASQTVGAALKRGDVVIYESTVYPGATEEICVPVLEQTSGLKFNIDFYCGYSPERINPGDKAHRLTTIKKVTRGSTPEAADAIDALYASIITAGTHKASSIRVAEAAKVIENTQRDLNIALMNELAILFNRLGLDTGDVLQAAGTAPRRRRSPDPRRSPCGVPSGQGAKPGSLVGCDSQLESSRPSHAQPGTRLRHQDAFGRPKCSGLGSMSQATTILTCAAAQHTSGGRGAHTTRLSRRSRHLRPPGQCRRGSARIRPNAAGATSAWDLRRHGTGRGTPSICRHGGKRYPCVAQAGWGVV